MALAQPRPPDVVDDFHAERTLAAHVLKQAVDDLANGRQRAGAAAFLLRLRGSLWASWWPELDLADVDGLVARKTAQPPRRSGVKRRRVDGVETETG